MDTRRMSTSQVSEGRGREGRQLVLSLSSLQPVRSSLGLTEFAGRAFLRQELDARYGVALVYVNRVDGGWIRHGEGRGEREGGKEGSNRFRLSSLERSQKPRRQRNGYQSCESIKSQSSQTIYLATFLTTVIIFNPFLLQKPHKKRDVSSILSARLVRERRTSTHSYSLFLGSSSISWVSKCLCSWVKNRLSA